MSVLRRIPGERFSEVVREWEDATVAILAGGPSFGFDQASRIIVGQARGLRVIAVNDAYLLVPHADVCYFADSEWWAWQTKGIRRSALGLSADEVRARFAAFKGEKCSIRWSGMNVEDEAVHILRNKHGEHVHGDGISLDPTCLVSGKNSGFQAINLAILAGAKRILLLGFDGKPDESGRNHWFGENPRAVRWDQFYENMRRAFSAAEREIEAAGVSVINCNPASRIDSFPKMTLEAALA